MPTYIFKTEIYFFGFGFGKFFAISVTSALVTSPFVNFNSSIACSLVNPFFVISLTSFSGKGDGVRGGAAADADDNG